MEGTTIGGAERVEHIYTAPVHDRIMSKIRRRTPLGGGLSAGISLPGGVVLKQTAPRPALLSKSGYLAGLQCPRLLWVRCNDRDRLSETDPGVQFLFEQGHLVGELARRLFPDGMAIDWDVGLAQVLRRSRAALAARRPLFEPGFLFGGAFTRADILKPVGRRRWDIIEVKSTASVKPQHIEDLAFQRHVYEGAGVPIRRCLVMHIDTGYLRCGEVDPEALFALADVTAEVKALQPGIAGRVRRMLHTIGRPRCPAAKVGARCSSPYPCPLQDECWSFLPARSVFTLVAGPRKAWALMDQGVLSLRDIPSGFALTARQQIQIRAVRQGRAHVNRRALRRFLSKLRYPLHLLDFETIGTPIPLYERSRPYQQVPFQCSVHVVERPGATARRCSFLPRTRKDPRPRLLELLRDELGEQGSIVAYFASFERQRLKECARDFPEHAGWIHRALPRIVDLWAPFSAFAYYHPRQEGSTSLKAVLPALTGRGYNDLAIADGQLAGMRFLEMVLGGLPRRERDAIHEQLEAYCGRDTEGMIWIIDRLRELVARRPPVAARNKLTYSQL